MSRHSTKTPGVYYRFTTDGERRYEIQFTDSEGRQVFRTVEGGYEDAIQARNQITGKLYLGEQVVVSDLTVSDLWEICQKHYMKHLKDSTKLQYKESYRAQIGPRFGKMKVRDVTKRVVASRLVNELRETHSPHTIKNAMKPLSLMMDLAIDEGWIGIHPVKGLSRRDRPAGYASRQRPLEPDEIEMVLTNSSGVERVLLMTALFTGLRQGELFRLRWEDIDFAKSELYVKESKTRAGIRSVVIPEDLLRELSTLSFESDSDAVFPLGPDTLKKWAEKARAALSEALGGIEGVVFHDLRHTYASMLINEADADLALLSRQIGHSNLAITLGVYGHLMDAERKKAAMRGKLSSFLKTVLKD